MFRNRNLSALTWLRLIRVAQKVSHAGAEHITRYGISGALFDVLAHIASHEGITQDEVAEQLLVTKGNISQLLTKLVQKGLIEKRQQGHANHLYVTTSGKALIDEIIPNHDVFITERMSLLAEDELRQLHDLLSKLDKRLG